MLSVKNLVTSRSNHSGEILAAHFVMDDERTPTTQVDAGYQIRQNAKLTFCLKMNASLPLRIVSKIPPPFPFNSYVLQFNLNIF